MDLVVVMALSFFCSWGVSLRISGSPSGFLSGFGGQ